MELERFIKVYSFLPLEERNLTVVVINEEPVNWKRAYEEIKNRTELGKNIYEMLVKRGMI